MIREFNQLLIDSSPVALWILSGGLLTVAYTGAKFDSPASIIGATVAAFGLLAILKKSSTVNSDS